MEYMLTRLEWLVGPDKIKTLKDTSVALFGVGGVGGGALEALVRWCGTHRSYRWRLYCT